MNGKMLGVNNAGAHRKKRRIPSKQEGSIPSKKEEKKHSVKARRVRERQLFFSLLFPHFAAAVIEQHLNNTLFFGPANLTKLMANDRTGRGMKREREMDLERKILEEE